MERIHPTQYNWGRRRGRAWTSDDVTCAQFLRHCGMTNEDIAEVLDRTTRSVEGKIGYQRTREHSIIYEAARPYAAVELGTLADSYLADHTAGAA